MTSSNRVEWIDKSGDPKLVFFLSDEGKMRAELHQKNIRGDLCDTGVRADERNMTIETENLSALVRGIPQKTFYIGKLSAEQKKAIMGSMQSRTIEVIKGHNDLALIIHALP